MLLDDVMSELDLTRRELLSPSCAAAGRASSPRPTSPTCPEPAIATVTRLRISPGAILQEAIAA